VIARGVRTIGDEDERRAPMLTPLEQRRRGEQGIVDGGAARRTLAVEPRAQRERRPRPGPNDSRFVNE
jgi:hypothetical protein